ncbi:hypothetical protein HMI56_001352 [Coelomomyces lativittatus]|nr:hypothetical protein HMI56_001352 [Coelomomyces lativittatus]
MDLGRLVYAKVLQLMFQGGYVGNPIHVYHSLTSSPYQWQKSMTIYPENNNTLQSFSFSNLSEKIMALKWVIETSSDSYGRVVVYSLGVLGTEA